MECGKINRRKETQRENWKSVCKGNKKVYMKEIQDLCEIYAIAQFTNPFEILPLNIPLPIPIFQLDFHFISFPSSLLLAFASFFKVFRFSIHLIKMSFVYDATVRRFALPVACHP